jgi:hypothetical protein
VYLRETRRVNKDGSVVRYLQLAHNERHPETGVSTARVIHNFGRADQVDRGALARLVGSIARVLDPADAPATSGDVEILESRPMGGAWVLDRLWERLGIGGQVRDVARRTRRRYRIDPEAVERVIFAMVANRALDPLSKLAGCRWISERVWIPGLAATDDDTCYRAMDFFLTTLAEIQRAVFFAVADLLTLEVDLVFFDTTSTYFEVDRPDEFRRHGHSKDHRPDLPQVVVGMAVTRGGIPVRAWVWPGNTSDQTVLDEVRRDLAGWSLNRAVWVVDSGFASAANRRVLSTAGGHYIVAEKLRSDSAEVQAALARQGRYQRVADNLEVKEVRVGEHDRFVIARNSEQADRDAHVRGEIVAQLEAEIANSDQLPARKRAELCGALRTKPAYNRYLRVTPGGLLRIDAAAINNDARLDGKFLLRCSDPSLSAADLALGYKSLSEVERGWRDMKSTLDLRPVYHRLEHRITAHVQLCWLALLLIRVIETTTGDTWRNTRNELQRLHLVTLATPAGTVAQRSTLTPGQRDILAALDLGEPARYHDFTPST